MVDTEKVDIAAIIKKNKEEREALEARLAAMEERLKKAEDSNAELTGAILGGAVPQNQNKTQPVIKSTPKTLDDFIANEVAKRK